MGFDVPLSDQIEKQITGSGVCVKNHKLIFKFTDQLKNLISDAKINQGDIAGTEVVSQAKIKQVFEIK